MHSILIVEDNPEIQSWLREVAVSAFPGATNLQIAASRQDGISMGCSRTFDLALVDLCLPDGSGIDVIRAITTKSDRTISIATTVLGDDFHVVSALTAGAKGYLLKEQSKTLLVHQLSQISLGLPALSPSIAKRLMEHFRLTGPCVESEGELTSREREVLALIARGLRVADAACALGVAESTIATHIKAIYRKLGISSRAEATIHATHFGLLSPNSKEVNQKASGK